MYSEWRDAITREETGYLLSVYNLIEQITLQELSDTSKYLVRNYLEEAEDPTPIERARSAVERYTSTQLPSLQHIRDTAAHTSLSELDHLILKMEWAANELDNSLRTF